MADRLAEEAKNETIFREMNEWSEELTDDASGVHRTGDDAYLCECSDSRCAEPIMMSRGEYEAVRSDPVRFAIALNHENPEIDRLLFENPRFAIVEKLPGIGASTARMSDPRR